MEIERGRETFLREAFSRNIGLVTQGEQEIISASKVAIAGLGGVGGSYCLAMARTGFGNFSIADFDSFDTVNINRQVGATVGTIGKKKSEVLDGMIREINPFAKVEVFSEGIGESNIDNFLKDADVAIDGLDFFAISERILFFKKAKEMGIIAVTAAPIGFGSSILVFDPKGMDFEKYFDIRSSDSELEKIIKFGVGLCPKMLQRAYVGVGKFDFSNRKTPSLYGGILACSSIVVAECVKVVLGKKISFVPYSYQFDPFIGKSRGSRLFFGNRSILQRAKISYLIKKSKK